MVLIFVQNLSPSKVKPDMSSLRLCKESELRRGQIIGSGAFGTVYKVSTKIIVLQSNFNFF